MIHSMTGYGRMEEAGPRLAVSAEVKSVNHRHLDIALKLPRALTALEPDARRLIQSAVQRGRVDAAVTLSAVEGQSLTPLTLNLGQARDYVDIAHRLSDELNVGGAPTVTWLMEQPGVVSREAEPSFTAEEVWPLLERALTRAVGEMVARRAAEGDALRRELTALGAALTAQVDVMSQRAPVAVERRTARLRERLGSLLNGAPIDEARILTEAAIWAEKSDITEELARLRAHLDQLARLLEQGGVVGRALDFLLQEMNRETNTVGSKADDLEITEAVIAAKSTLEKLREQAQNIE